MNKNYSIQLFRLIAALMVVVIHTNPFKEINEYLAFEIKEIFSRVAVPFFFCLAGYFYMKNREKKDYLRNYIIKILKIYVVWGLIYFPYSFIYQAFKSDRSFVISTIDYIRNVILTGAHFHLWYFPALICGMILFQQFYKRFEMKKIIILAIILYGIGLLGLSYHGILNGMSKKIMYIYLKIFMTTRNGVFFGFPFVTMGAYLAKIDLEKYEKNKLISKILIFYFLLNIEVFYLMKMNMLTNSDGFIFLPFLIFYLMIFLIKDYIKKYSQKFLKLISYEDYSLGIYVIHGIYLIIYGELSKIVGLENQKTIYFLLVLLSSMISIWMLKKMINKNRFQFLKKYI